MRNKSTLQKLISFMQKDIDKLLVEKANLEFEIKSLHAQLENLKLSLEQELKSFNSKPFNRFDIGLFIDNELTKQKKINSEISSSNIIVENLIKEITYKNVEKKTHQHLLDEILAKEQIEIEKSEQKMIDEFAIYSIESRA